MIIFGRRLFGRTDYVAVGSGSEKKPLFHVATLFAHVQFIPLYPLSSHLFVDVLEGSQAVSIPISGKSVAVAWLRCTTYWTTFFLGIFSLPAADEFSWQLFLCFVVALAFAILVTWHGFFNDASYERAIELLGHVNGGERFNSAMKRIIAMSYISQSLESGILEELESAMPTTTGELMEVVNPDYANELVPYETTACIPVGASDSDSISYAPTAVAVLQDAPAKNVEYAFSQDEEQTQRGQELTIV